MALLSVSTLPIAPQNSQWSKQTLTNWKNKNSSFYERHRRSDFVQPKRIHLFTKCIDEVILFNQRQFIILQCFFFRNNFDTLHKNFGIPQIFRGITKIVITIAHLNGVQWEWGIGILQLLLTWIHNMQRPINFSN